MLVTKDLTNTAWTQINFDYVGSWQDLQQPDTGISIKSYVGKCSALCCFVLCCFILFGVLQERIPNIIQQHPVLI